mgnify:CR=1 FL=1
MKITEVRLGLISVPLRVPFKTALRSVSSVEDVIGSVIFLASDASNYVTGAVIAADGGWLCE